MAEASSFKAEYNPNKQLYVVVPVTGGGEIPSKLNGAWTHKAYAEKAIRSWVDEERDKYAKQKRTTAKPANKGISN